MIISIVNGIDLEDGKGELCPDCFVDWIASQKKPIVIKNVRIED